MTERQNLSFLLLLSALLFSCSAKPASPALSTPFKGQAKIYDQYAPEDAFSLRVTGAPEAPAGFVYEGWLVGPQGPLNLGLLALTTEETKPGEMSFHWTSPKGSNLVQEYTEFEATWEPQGGSSAPTGRVVFSGKISSLGAELFRQKDQAPQPPALGLQSQVALAVEHAGMAKAAAQLQDWSEMKAHLEHVINILEGRKGALYGDYLGTGVPQNPGDGWGARTYAQQTFDLLKSSESRDSATMVYQTFQTETGVVEKTCLALLKHFEASRAPGLVIQLSQQVKSLEQGPTQKLYQLALQTLTIPLELTR